MRKVLNKLAAAGLVLPLLMAMVSCSVSSTESIKSISVDPSSVHIYADYGKQLHVTAIDTRGEESDVSTACIYKSSDKKVAIVNATGFIEGKDRGEAVITISITVGDVTQTATVPVIIELVGGTETFSGVS